MGEAKTIVISSSGVVALYTALRLRQCLPEHWSILLHGSPPPPQPEVERDLFINLKNYEHLLDLGLQCQKTKSVNQIVLQVQGIAQTIRFAPEDLRSTNIYGVVCPLSSLRLELYQIAQQTPGIEIIAAEDMRFQSYDEDFSYFQKGDHLLRAHLLILTGRQHPIQLRHAFARTEGSYHQASLSGIVHCTQALAETAWQLFLDSGPLALLPTSEPEHYSYIWTLAQPQAEELVQASAEQRAAKMQAWLGSEFGSITEKVAYPPTSLYWRYHRRLACASIALLGEADRIIHPMAGMGANFGFFSAECLVETLTCHRDADPRRSLEVWQNKVFNYPQTIDAVLKTINVLSPHLNPSDRLASLAHCVAENLTHVFQQYPSLRRKISAFAGQDRHWWMA